MILIYLEDFVDCKVHSLTEHEAFNVQERYIFDDGQKKEKREKRIR